MITAATTRRPYRRAESHRPRLASHRQINYWASHGALGDRHRDVGSGCRHNWTEREAAAVDAIASTELGAVMGKGGIHHAVVTLLWTQLMASDVATVRLGGVTITAHLVPPATPQAGRPQGVEPTGEPTPNSPVGGERGVAG